MNYENSENINPLNIVESKKQYQHKQINKNKERRNFKHINTYHNIGTKPYISILNTSSKASSILNTKSELHATKTKCYSIDVTDIEQNMQVSSMFDDTLEHAHSQNTFFEKEANVKEVLQNEKQKLNYMDTWNKLLNENSSFIDDKTDTLNKNCLISMKSNNLTERKELEYNKNLSKRQKDLLSLIPNDIPTDFTSECQDLLPLQGIESEGLQESIDFSSNEIFNAFHYEFYYNNSSDYLTSCLMNSEKTCNSLRTDKDIKNKKGDMNDNDFDPPKITEYWSSTKNKQNNRNTSKNKSLMHLKYSDQDLLLSSDKKSKCSSNCSCDDCFEDWISNWIDNAAINCTQNELLTDTPNENSSFDLKKFHFDTTEVCEDIIDEILKEFNATEACSSLIDTEDYLQCSDNIDSLLNNILSYINEEPTDEELFAQNMHVKSQKEYNEMEFDNSSNKTDLDEVSQMLKEEIDLYDTDKDSEYKFDANEKQFPCLVCSLTFTNPRTMAMHQASAHGGMYIILCESCGVLFNRKYHFNRHLVHCNRLKKDYKCDKCMKKYRHKSSLIHHLKVAHEYSRSDLNIFICDECKKKYVRFGAFENHMKSHKKELDY